MEQAKELAKYYKETKESLENQRRAIDFDMANILKNLQQDHSTEGKLKVLYYKSEIQQAEVAYDDRVSELESIDKDLKPILVEINANINDPLLIHLEGRSYFDTYLNENKQIVTTPEYTKL